MEGKGIQYEEKKGDPRTFLLSYWTSDQRKKKEGKKEPDASKRLTPDRGKKETKGKREQEKMQTVYYCTFAPSRSSKQRHRAIAAAITAREKRGSRSYLYGGSRGRDRAPDLV